MDQPNEHQQAKQLWRQYRSKTGSPGACPDSLQLASYAEERCSGDDIQEIEGHLALCPTCMETIIFLKDPQLNFSEAPSFVLEQAKRLIPGPAPIAVPIQEAKRWWSWGWGLQWAAMAATCAGICVIGFNLGMAAQQNRMQIDQVVVSEMVFGLGDYPGGLGAEIKPEIRGEV